MQAVPQNTSTPRAWLPVGHFWARIPQAALAIGLLSFLVAFLLGKGDPARFFFTFHTWGLFYLGLVVGAIFFVIIQFATKSGWSVSVRRLAENVALTIPLFIFFFAVMCVGAHTLFHHWMGPDAATDAVLQMKSWYLNEPFFFVRGAIYLAIFIVSGLCLARWSRQQDVTKNHNLTRKMQNASIPLGILMGLAITFGAFDWIMSLEPHWYSTIFGLYIFASFYLSFLALLVILTRSVDGVLGPQGYVTKEHYHDMGKLVFGHTIFWTYAAFVQYLLIWYGNIPEETIWYAHRQHEGWIWIWALLWIGRFVVPFVLLMPRAAKRSKNWLTGVSVWVVLMAFVDMYWLVMPVYSPAGPVFGFLDLFMALGFGGLLAAVFGWACTRHALVPVGDPRLGESLHYENV